MACSPVLYKTVQQFLGGVAKRTWVAAGWLATCLINIAVLDKTGEGWSILTFFLIQKIK